MSGCCPNCDTRHEIVEVFFVRIALTTVAGLLGLATGNAFVALLLASLAAWVGRLIDRWLAQRCPECWAALHVIETFAAA